MTCKPVPNVKWMNVITLVLFMIITDVNSNSNIHKKTAGFPAAVQNGLGGGRSWRWLPFTAYGHFSVPQELYQAKPGTALPVAS